MITHRTYVRKERHGINKSRYVACSETALFGLYGWRWISRHTEQRFGRRQDANKALLP